MPQIKLNTREIFWISLHINIGGISSKHTEETKNHLRTIALNKTVASKTKTLISEATQGTKNPFYGNVHSESSKILISLGMVLCLLSVATVVSSVKILGKMVK